MAIEWTQTGVPIGGTRVGVFITVPEEDEPYLLLLPLLVSTMPVSALNEPNSSIQPGSVPG